MLQEFIVKLKNELKLDNTQLVGCVVSKSCTFEPRDGNPEPIIGMMEAI